MYQSLIDILQKDFPLIGMFICGILAWCATGVDDLLIFREIYTQSQQKQKKLQPIFGLSTAVGVMIIVVLVLVKLTSQVPNGLKYIQITAGMFVFYLSYKTLKNGESEEDSSTSQKTSNFFWLSFWGYTLNSSDDISVFLSITLNKNPMEIFFFFLGVVSGVVGMIALVFVWGKVDTYPPFPGYNPIKLGKWLFLSTAVFLSKNVVRGITLLCVSAYLFFSAFW